ncbi:mannonate dehydratase [Alkalicoccus halolimnae]|uniref:Mannonate dehydratase n=1 Tax=Alkalicoccus halolimnae TaxID=1667239 RepID=A0A5C7FJ84_9BACI|nr:mannonate dehydratase [Alkalicoccus halolimnae]TXF85486.1 mannonate dehydratase [Alkalicoccus halolimnae]
MEMSFRWYGKSDPVTLSQIRQIPDVEGIVTAVYDYEAGEVWSKEVIDNLKNTIEKEGFTWNVVESVPVHEDIKLGKDSRDKWIENYKQTMKHLSANGIKTICYNFMPVFDWTRTELNASLPDGSNSLAYDENTLETIDPLSGELTLPGWDLSYQTEDLKKLMEDFRQLTEEQLMENLIYFLKEIMPTAEEEDIKLAIHPDDPPWSIFGLPRVVTGKQAVQRILTEVDSPSNGITFCSGSYGADEKNDLETIIQTAAGRIHFVHLRNIKYGKGRSFQETAHSKNHGSLNMIQLVRKLHEAGFSGPVRPDHGRMIWGEKGRPGYGLYDRALGAQYLNGIIHTLEGSR